MDLTEVNAAVLARGIGMALPIGDTRLSAVSGYCEMQAGGASAVADRYDERRR
jgi:hypothetical protein